MLGQKGQHQIQFIIVRKANDDIRLADAFLCQQINIRAVSANNDALINAFRHHTAPFRVFFDNLDIDILFIQHLCQGSPRTSGADDEDPFRCFHTRTDKLFAEPLNFIRRADEKSIVMRQKPVFTVRNDHTVITEDKARQYILRQNQIFQRDIGQRGLFADLGFKKAYLPLCKIFHIKRRRGHKNAIDFTGRNIFGINHEINIKIFL